MVACITFHRAGLKLEAALEHFGVDVTGLRCLDAGLSTGGFTDCLLQRGAEHVTGVDVGYGQACFFVLSRCRLHVVHAPHGTARPMVARIITRLLQLLSGAIWASQDVLWWPES